MAKVKKHGKLYSYAMIIIGTAILAFGVQCFYDPIGLVTGGFSGLAIIIKDISSKFYENGIPLWITNVGLNVPVFVLAFFLKGYLLKV